MKILFVITGLGVGGAERQVVALADSLSVRGHEVCIVDFFKMPTIVEPVQNVKVISLGMSKNTYGYLRCFFPLRKIISQFQPDVVHSHMVHANLLTRLIRLTIKIPKLVCTAHNTNEGGWLRMLAYRLTDRLADISTNVSDEAVAAFVKNKAVRPGRMIRVYNGISTQHFSFNDEERLKLRQNLFFADKKILLSVGRLSEQKDYPNLFKAISMLKKVRQDFKVVIVGDGPLKEFLIQEALDLNIDNDIKFLGLRKDIPSLMSAADIFVLSSAYEGFPLVVGESMACESLVVATDCGGVSEFVGDCGFLVPPKDPIGLFEALNKSLNMPYEDVRLMGSNARQRIIDNFSLDKVTDNWLTIYTATH